MRSPLKKIAPGEKQVRAGELFRDKVRRSADMFFAGPPKFTFVKKYSRA